MRVFVTGATGLIGSAVVAELISHGHTVLALARSDASARAVQTAGAEPLRGALSDLDILRAGAAAADGVIHVAFATDLSTHDALMAAIAEDGVALGTLGEALVDSGRPLVIVSGTPRTPGRPSTEADPLTIDGPTSGRVRTVTAALALAARGVRCSAVRLPRTVHNNGLGGFAGLMTKIPERAALRAIPATASSVGRPCMHSTQLRCFGLRWSGRRPGPPGMRSQMRATGCVTSRP